MAALQVPAQAAREHLFRSSKPATADRQVLKVKDEKGLILLIVSVVEHLL